MGEKNILVTDNYDYKTFNALMPGANDKSIGTTAREVCAEPCRFLGYLLHNNAASVVTWALLFFRPAGEVTVGETPPDLTIKMGADQSVAWDLLRPLMQHCDNIDGTPGSSGNLRIEALSVASTATEAGSAAPATLTTGTFFFKRLGVRG